jgi:hypothetical protein
MTTQNNTTLYELKEQFRALYELALEDGDEQAFLDTLESLVGDLQNKARGCVYVIKQLEMEEDQCDKVIEAFTAKKKARENSKKKIKQRIMEAMEAAYIDTLKAGEYTLKIAKNGGAQPLKIDGEVPDKFTKVIVQPDNDLIRKALNDGEELEFAHLEPRGRHLNIK